ncbi:MAG TPA: FIST N-terminal domain-containing protein, partial [Anaerolineae bacterium]|nr:FIST N-terminal domain-containing protein [Anaerolineae bacterium]
AAIRQAGAPARALLTLAFMGPEEKLLDGATQVAPGVPVVGGSASDHTPEGKWQQYGSGHAHTGAFTIAAIGGEVGYAFSHGYHPTGKKAVITKASGRKLIEIDGRPAMDVYAEWTKMPKADLGGSAILMYSVLHPLLLRKNGLTLAVHPVAGYADGSIETGVALAEGRTLELGESTVDGLIAEVEQVIKAAAQGVKKPAAVILSHCGGRAIGLGDRIGEVTAQVRRAAGDIPWIGYLAFGEQGCLVPGEASHANLSLSALVLGE